MRIPYALLPQNLRDEGEIFWAVTWLTSPRLGRRQGDRVALDRDRRLVALVSSQYWVFHRVQALTLGYSRDAIQRRLRSGLWEPVHEQVYRLPTAPSSWEQEVMAACLWGGPHAVASHSSAAAVWGIVERTGGVIEFSSPRRMTRPSSTLVSHRRIGIHSCDVTRRRGLPVTKPERTLLDLAAVVTARRLERALDEALRRKMTTLPRLRERLEALGRRGRNGTAAFRLLLNERAGLYRPTDSDLEDDFAALVKRFRLPMPQRQKHVTTRRGRTFRCDFVYVPEQIAIELDSYRHHGTWEAFERDRAQSNALILDGWLLLRYTYRDIHETPERVAAEILDALRQRGHVFGVLG